MELGTRLFMGHWDLFSTAGVTMVAGWQGFRSGLRTVSHQGLRYELTDTGLLPPPPAPPTLDFTDCL